MAVIEVSAFGPGRFDLPLYAGDTFIMDLTISSKDPVSGVVTPTVLDDLTFKGDIKADRLQATAVSGSFTFTKSLTTPGLVRAKLSSTVTTALGDLTVDKLAYDIQYTDADGDVYTQLTGDVTFMKQVTR